MTILRKGARNAHRYSKLPIETVPPESKGVDGVVTTDPMAMLRQYAIKYGDAWEAQYRQVHYDWPTREALPRPTVQELRQSSRSVDERTAIGHDGFHVTHFRMLSDECLAVLAALVEASELVGSLPRQLHFVTVPLLDKQKGGHRPISIYPAMYRLWTRVRKPYTEAWERQHQRAYFASAKARSAQDAVWRQAVKAEMGVAVGGQAASVFWDMTMFYEHVRRDVLCARAAAIGFPQPLLRLALSTYAAPAWYVLLMRYRPLCIRLAV